MPPAPRFASWRGRGADAGIGPRRRRRRSGMNADVMVVRKDCAMVGCTQPAAPMPLIVNVATLPGPFQIPLCTLCREPFDAGMEAVELLLDGDAEAVPFIRGRPLPAVLEVQR